MATAAPVFVRRFNGLSRPVVDSTHGCWDGASYTYAGDPELMGFADAHNFLVTQPTKTPVAELELLAGFGRLIARFGAGDSAADESLPLKTDLMTRAATGKGARTRSGDLTSKIRKRLQPPALV